MPRNTTPQKKPKLPRSVFAIRLSPEERAELHAAATLVDGGNVSSFVRRAIRERIAGVLRAA
jgi:uncharacterized protein (DUF1778 family)